MKLVLVEQKSNVLLTMKLIRKVNYKDLKTSKMIVDRGGMVLYTTDLEYAKQIKREFEDLGAVMRLEGEQ